MPKITWILFFFFDYHEHDSICSELRANIVILVYEFLINLIILKIERYLIDLFAYVEFLDFISQAETVSEVTSQAAE